MPLRNVNELILDIRTLVEFGSDGRLVLNAEIHSTPSAFSNKSIVAETKRLGLAIPTLRLGMVCVTTLAAMHCDNPKASVEFTVLGH